jgi:hypothetical protein
MREQGSAGLGLTVSRKFDSKQEADGAVKQLRDAGFREEDIRVWQMKKHGGALEDRLARTMEGLLAGGVISALIAFFVTAAYNWREQTVISNETAPAAALIAAVAGAVLVAIIVNIVSTKYAFNRHPHEAHAEPASVVTVRAGDKEAQAKQVFKGVSH